MSLNLNDAPKQRNFDPIPDGSFVKLLLQIKPNGFSINGMDPMDNGLFKSSKSSDAVMLECEFTVLEGPHVHRKWSEHWVVAGGSVDDKGQSKGYNMTKTRLRAMIESNQDIKPDDNSAQATATRQIRGFKELDNIQFWAKVKIDPGEPYTDPATGAQKMGFDKNVIDRIVTPDMAEYADLAAGKEVAPKPSGAKRLAKEAPAAAPARSWGGGTAPGSAQAQAAAELPLQQQPSAEPARKPAWLK